MEAEKRFMEEQVKASKRQNKLLVMALSKQEGNQANIETQIDNWLCLFGLLDFRRQLFYFILSVCTFLEPLKY